jgi:hypothetical protein
VAARRTGANHLLQLPWDETVPVGTVGRTVSAGNVSDVSALPTIAASSDNGEVILCTAAAGANNAAKIATVNASSDGSLYFQDTANNVVYVRQAPLVTTTADAANFAAMFDTDPEKAERSQLMVIRF